MKKPLWIGLATALMYCAGCVTPPHESLTATTTTPQRTVASEPPVSADRVTVENCHLMAQALFDELDQEANRAMVEKSLP